MNNGTLKMFNLCTMTGVRSTVTVLLGVKLIPRTGCQVYSVMQEIGHFLE